MVGNVANIMEPNEASTAALYLKTPILTNEQLAVIKSLMTPKLHTATLSMLYPVNNGAEGMETAIESLCIDALKAIKNGANILVLSDRGINSRMAAIPALLARPPPSLPHRQSRPLRRRPGPGIGRTARSPSFLYPHRLRNYGINPYIALESIKELIAGKKLPRLDYEQARQNYIDAAVKGILAVMSKMGISTIHSYHAPRF